MNIRSYECGKCKKENALVLLLYHTKQIDSNTQVQNKQQT